VARATTSRPRPDRRTARFGVVFAVAALLALLANARAAELPALHTTDKPPQTPAGDDRKGFDIPGTNLSVHYGGYIEGAVVMTLPRNAAAARHRKPTP
jgi:hypothetical protein